MIQCSISLFKQISLIDLTKVNKQERERVNQEITPETIGDLRDQVDEEKPSKIQSHRLDFLYLIIIIFYFSVAEKQPARQTKLGEKMLSHAEVL